MIRRHSAIKQAKKFIQEFNNVILRANLVGSLVRDPKKHNYVNDIDIAVITTQKIYHGPPLNLFYTNEEEWEACLLHFSIGMKIIQLKRAALYRGMKFTAHGLFIRKRIPKLITTDANEICELIETPMPFHAKQVLGKGVGRLK